MTRDILLAPTVGRNTLLEERKSRKAEYDLDIRSQEEKLILRNRELENREIMRQIEEHRAEREQRDRDAEEARIREEAVNIARENLRKYMQRAQNTSRNKLETDDVFEEASGGDTRKSARDRKQTDKYVAGASCNAFDTRQNFDRNRRQSQSPNRQRSSSYDNRDRHSKNDRGNEKKRRSSDRSYRSSDRHSVETDV